MPASPPSDELLTRVAELRAAGRSWEAVGAAVKRKWLTVRTWPRRYPYRWTVAYAAAEAQLLAEVQQETLLTLRHQLRSASDTARSKAADLLLRHTGRVGGRRRPAARRPKISPQLLLAAAELEGKTDAELDQLLAELEAIVADEPDAGRTPQADDVG